MMLCQILLDVHNFMTTPTPRTDTLVRDMHESVSIEGATVENINVFIKHARDLEQELNQWKADAERLARAVGEYLMAQQVLGLIRMVQDDKELLSKLPTTKSAFQDVLAARKQCNAALDAHEKLVKGEK